MFISVIVPVYNTGVYLPKCIESIINQTYKNIEIILVDDGSTDESLEICMDYERKDSRIIVLKNNHQGLVETRKCGVKKAKGEYCIFVDSDDWIENTLLEKILALVEDGKIDIVNYGMSSVIGEEKIKHHYTISEGVYERQKLCDIYKKMMYDFEKNEPGILQSLCTKLIKRELLWKSIESEDRRITIGEDAAVVYNALLNAKKIVVTYDSLYFYRIHLNSMSRSKDIHLFTKIFFFQEYMKKIFSKYDIRYRLNEQLQAYLLHFIERGIKDNFSIALSPVYHIPLQLIRREDQKIVLYGAGNVGKSYYKQLYENNGITVVAWIDQRLQTKKIFNRKIDSLSILRKIKFDKILIAVKDQNTVKEIKEVLYNFTSEDKILWEEPQVDFWQKEINI